MPTVPFLGSYGDISGSGLMFRNKLINGGFDIWQRGTSQTSDGYGSDDRWINANTGSTKTASRQTFALGQTDVPGNPTYFARTVVSSVAGSGNYCSKQQYVEYVSTLAGQQATLSFWAKADATKNIAVEFRQVFGTGGSPSATVSFGVTTVGLTSTWQRISVPVSIPSISGKTLGTGANDFLEVRFWFDAGSTFNSRTNSLGQQSGTFDIANVQLEAGAQATPFEQRPFATELTLCQRYCEIVSQANILQQFMCHRAASTWEAWFGYKVPKRANATLKRADNLDFSSVVFGPSAGQCQIYSWALGGYLTGTFAFSSGPTASTNRYYFVFNNTAGTVGQIGICDQLIGGVTCYFEAEL